MSDIEISLTPTEKAILGHVRRNPECSRAEVSQDMGLSKAMLTKAVARFVDEGLVAEDRQDRPRSGRGQPAIRLRLRPTARVGVGVSLSTLGLDLAVSDLSYQIVATRSHPPAPSADNAVQHVVDKVGRLLDEDAAGVPLAGIGISIPGLLTDRREIHEITPSQRQIPFEDIRAALVDAFGRPVYFENHAPAFYESVRPANSHRVLLYIHLNYGIGGSLVVDGEIYRGGFNQAVNIGALLPETGPRPNLTDLSASLGEPGLTEARMAALMTDGDPRLLEWIDARGPLLSEPLSIAVQLLNPQLIVIGGLLPKSLLLALIAKIDLSRYDLAGRMPLTKPRIQVAALTGGDAVAGAVAAIPIARRFGL